jgi:hypothetical protein
MAGGGAARAAQAFLASMSFIGFFASGKERAIYEAWFIELLCNC